MKLPKGMTKKQLNTLLLIMPGPIGQGMKKHEAAKHLNICIRSVYYRLSRFKKKFPEQYQNFQSIINQMRTQGKWIQEWNHWNNYLDKFQKIQNTGCFTDRAGEDIPLWQYLYDNGKVKEIF